MCPLDTINPEQSLDENDIIIERSLPLCNSKEKIIIVVDIAEDENFTSFKLNNNSHKPLHMMKHAIELFLNSKYLINQKHEYALVILNENNAIWLSEFTNNISDVISALQNIGSCNAEDIFDLNTLFDIILENVEIPGECDLEEMLIPPPYVVRTVLFYGRSYTVPKLRKTKDIQKLLESPYYTFDVLMTHEPVDIDNNCNKIFKILQNLDRKGFAYFFPVSRDVKTLYDSVGKLLAHPLQRPIQKLANYNIEDIKI
ncbi:hypothetical protein BDFB_006277 [Asbolus verrucosus]|uniref:BRISC and BRCA1-A complex member 1 n=1 Tax=Asbolus verrucosus TaxID=1661398 RepID=A0A482W0B0_ASBVE|nr:hypothetical protein BDFB_006277 [Asbolus verrucosus]